MKITHKRIIDKKKKPTEQDIISYLLQDRGVRDVKKFMNPSEASEIQITEFGFKKELDKTFSILEKIYENKGTIVVYTDYDADGITGGTILWETLHLLGFNAMPYVPHRKHEGYGFSIKGIDNVIEKYHPALIISVDHGITAREKVSYAKSKGVPVIITDHHLKPELLPDDAEAIFHIPVLSGSGVSYVFSKAMYEHFAKKFKSPNNIILRHHFKTDYLALASIGTVADLVPLTGPSRSIVKHGLEAFPKVTRAGLMCIMRDAGIGGKKITPYEIGFVIAPRINAVGRLEHAIDALRLLCTTSESRASALSKGVGKTNADRQELVKTAVEEAKAQIEKIPEKKRGNVLILVSDKWHEGIIGLIASKITETYYRPTIVMTEVDGFLKGSARSIPSFHITNFLRGLKEYLIDVGGHTGAAGFTIENKQLKKFMQAVDKESKKQITKKDLERVLETDMSIPLGFITKTLAREIETLHPFGIGNPQPIFHSKGVLTDAQRFGKRQEHLKLYVKDPEIKTPALELIAFSKGEDFSQFARDQEIEVVYQPEIDRWTGAERLRAKLIYWQ